MKIDIYLYNIFDMPKFFKNEEEEERKGERKNLKQPELLELNGSKNSSDLLELN